VTVGPGWQTKQGKEFYLTRAEFPFVADGFGGTRAWLYIQHVVLGDGFIFESSLDSVSEIYLFMVAERGLLTVVGKHW
jgi:hypothetical protein